MPFVSFHAGGCWAPGAPWHKGEQAAVAGVSTLSAGSGERWYRLQHLSRPPWCSLGGLILSPCLVRACFGSHREPGARPGQQTQRGKPWTVLRRTEFIVLCAPLKIICQCWDFFLLLHIPISNSVAVKSPTALVADACCRSSITLLRSSGCSRTEGHTQADTGIFALVYNPISILCFVFWRS